MRPKIEYLGDVTEHDMVAWLFAFLSKAKFSAHHNYTIIVRFQEDLEPQRSLFLDQI